MKRMAVLFHAVAFSPFFCAGFVAGWLYWTTYAGFHRARELQIWMINRE